MTIIERVLQLLKDRNTSASDLCREAGIPQATFSAWKKRGTNPEARYIVPIADYFGVSERFILTGEEVAPQILIEKEIKTEQEERILEYFRSLNDLGKSKMMVAAYDISKEPDFTDEE